MKSQIENKKSVKMEDLGMIFLEFLYYYGYVFNQTNYVIFTNTPNQDNGLDNEISNYLNQNSHDIIIVDPLLRSNNVAKSTFQYSHIKVILFVNLDGIYDSFCRCEGRM